MNTSLSEGHTSAVRILRTVQPTRELFDPSRSRLKYVTSERTDIRRTFRKARLLALIQGKQS